MQHWLPLLEPNRVCICPVKVHILHLLFTLKRRKHSSGFPITSHLAGTGQCLIRFFWPSFILWLKSLLPLRTPLILFPAPPHLKLTQPSNSAHICFRRWLSARFPENITLSFLWTSGAPVMWNTTAHSSRTLFIHCQNIIFLESPLCASALPAPGERVVSKIVSAPHGTYMLLGSTTWLMLGRTRSKRMAPGRDEEGPILDRAAREVLGGQSDWNGGNGGVNKWARMSVHS